MPYQRIVGTLQHNTADSGNGKLQSHRHSDIHQRPCQRTVEFTFGRSSSQNFKTFHHIDVAKALPILLEKKTVAIAAPATPQSKTRMQNKSSRIFRTVEKSRNQNGVLLSPKARIMLDNKL